MVSGYGRRVVEASQSEQDPEDSRYRSSKVQVLGLCGARWCGTSCIMNALRRMVDVKSLSSVPLPAQSPVAMADFPNTVTFTLLISRFSPTLTS